MDKAKAAYSKLIQNNPSLKVLLPVVVICLVVLLVVQLTMGSSSTPAQTQPDEVGGAETTGNEVEVLPQTDRVEEGGVTIGNDPFSESSGAAFAVTGIIQSTSGQYRAVIAYSDGAMIVEENDYLGETNWMVEQIDMEHVYLTSETGDKTLELDTDDTQS